MGNWVMSPVPISSLQHLSLLPSGSKQSQPVGVIQLRSWSMALSVHGVKMRMASWEMGPSKAKAHRSWWTNPRTGAWCPRDRSILWASRKTAPFGPGAEIAMDSWGTGLMQTEVAQLGSAQTMIGPSS
jgi:hypothetical protein